MRTTLLSALVVVVGTAALAQAATNPGPAVVNPVAARPAPAGHPPHAHCCREKVWDRNGHEVGDLVAYDNSYGIEPLIGWVAYRLKGGDAVLLHASAEALYGLQTPSSSLALFTTSNCTGNSMFASISFPPLAKRYAMVLVAGSYTSPASEWLFVTDPLPSRVIPGAGTVFHSQWQDISGCSNYPAPGFTSTNPPGGYWTHRIEDLAVKFKPPYYVDY